MFAAFLLKSISALAGKLAGAERQPKKKYELVGHIKKLKEELDHV